MSGMRQQFTTMFRNIVGSLTNKATRMFLAASDKAALRQQRLHRVNHHLFGPGTRNLHKRIVRSKVQTQYHTKRDAERAIERFNRWDREPGGDAPRPRWMRANAELAVRQLQQVQK